MSNEYKEYASKDWVLESLNDRKVSWDELDGKPFGEVTDWTLVIAEATYANNSMLGSWANTDYSHFRVAGTYRFTIDGTDTYVYEKTMSGVSFPVGDSSFVNYPFCTEFRGNHYIKFQDGASHTLKVEFLTAMSKPLDEVYIPDTIARVTYVDDCMSAKADVDHVHAFADLTDVPFGEIAVQVGDDPSMTVSPTTITTSGQKVNGNASVGTRHVIRFDGKLYECDYVHQGEGSSMITYYGNLALCDAGDDNGLPFCLKRQNNNTYCYVADELISHTVEAFVGRIDILRLNEKYIPDTIARTEHKHSWNDLEDKPFGEEQELVVIQEGRTGAVAPIENPKDGYSKYGCLAASAIIAGETYIVTVDSVEYTGVAFTFEDPYNSGVCIFGQFSDFSVAPINIYTYGVNAYANFADDVGPDIKIVHVKSATVQAIDDKFIPETIARVDHEHSWDDLNNRPFGIETGKSEMTENMDIYDAMVDSDGSGVQLLYVANGIEYRLTGKEIYDNRNLAYDNNTFYRYVGDISLFPDAQDCGGDLSGDDVPFLFMIAVNNQDKGSADKYLSHTYGVYSVVVYKETTSINTLNEKFIPDSIARVDDVTTQLTTALSDYYTQAEVEVFHDEIKDYVDEEVAALVNAAPETLDTIGELATAFAENKEVVDALDASITNKQDKVSDTLILVDTVTGKQHKLQIQNGQLVSFPVEE